MFRSWPERLLLLTGLLSLGACGNRDPFLRDDVWKPTGANAGNMAAMVADPHDLVMGRGSAWSDAKSSTVAIDRIWTDHPRPLIIGTVSGGGAGSGGGSGGGAGGSGASPGGSGSGD